MFNLISNISFKDMILSLKLLLKVIGTWFIDYDCDLNLQICFQFSAVSGLILVRLQEMIFKQRGHLLGRITQMLNLKRVTRNCRHFNGKPMYSLFSNVMCVSSFHVSNPREIVPRIQVINYANLN